MHSHVLTSAVSMRNHQSGFFCGLDRAISVNLGLPNCNRWLEGVWVGFGLPKQPLKWPATGQSGVLPPDSCERISCLVIAYSGRSCSYFCSYLCSYLSKIGLPGAGGVGTSVRYRHTPRNVVCHNRMAPDTPTDHPPRFWGRF